MTKITMNIAHWKDNDIHYMTIFTCFLKWRWNKVGYGQHFGHLKKIMIMFQINKFVNKSSKKIKKYKLKK
jgi:hypothetical protein